MTAPDVRGQFPDGFFARVDEEPDGRFYSQPRFVTHIDNDAISAVGDLYKELGIEGVVLDLMGSHISHFKDRPAHLIVHGMNRQEVRANMVANQRFVHDLNQDPELPLKDSSVDHVVCCVSVDYLTQPLEVFKTMGRVLRPGGTFVCTFSNRLFPTKAIRGWMEADDEGRCAIVGRYFELSGCFGRATVERRTPADHVGDPLFAVWAARPSQSVPRRFFD